MKFEYNILHPETMTYLYIWFVTAIHISDRAVGLN
jgi:hypothetical protein